MQRLQISDSKAGSNPATAHLISSHVRNGTMGNRTRRGHGTFSPPPMVTVIPPSDSIYGAAGAPAFKE